MDRVIPTFRPGVPGLLPDAWIVAPPKGPSTPPVVAVHGITRNVEEMVEHLLPRVQATGRTLVVPHFAKAYWPRYQRAACSKRADWALLRLMATLRAEGRVGAGRFDLAGFSGGAQFAHRFTWLYPHLVGRLCATAPGWWTFPDRAAPWPYGIGAETGADLAQSFRLTANLRRFLDRRIVVCVGGDDVLRDANLRQGADIDAQQGITRVQRAQRWVAAAEGAARAEGLSPAISLRILPGCGHSFADCVVGGGLDRDIVTPVAGCATCRNATTCQGRLSTQIIEPQITDQLMERTAA